MSSASVRSTKSRQWTLDALALHGIAEFAGLENDGVEQEETYILYTMKWTQTNVYDT